MAINSVGLNSTAPNVTPSSISPTASETKSIQNEITSQSQRLNRLSSDSKMSAEEKAKKRQEIQKEIAELNRKLRMLRMEQKEEDKKTQKEQEAKTSVIKEQITETSKEESKKDSKDADGISSKDSKFYEEENEVEELEKTAIPPQDIQKLLEAGTLLQKDRIQQSVQRQETSAENILDAEIKSDKLYGTDPSAKEEKLASMIKTKPVEILIEEKKNDNHPSGNKIPGKIVISDNIL